VTVTPPTRVHGTAIFMTAQPTGTPAALVHNLRYNKMLHQHVVVLTVSTVPRPHVNPDERVTVLPMGANIYNTRIQYGFMEDPDVPEVLVHLRQVGVPIDEDDVTFFLGRETIVVGRRNGMATWREKLFVLMARNAVRATAFFKLPPERVVELGVQVEM
jgi:KUP system potassium uptake protein